MIAQPIETGGRELNITCSMGFSMYPKDGGDPETLLKNADAAMYRAKEQGRNNFQFYTAEINSKINERLSLEADLRQALRREELYLAYQPQVDAEGSRIIGVEALLRWRHPTLGEIPPSRFIGLAEETGLIVPLGEWVLHKACEQGRAWTRTGLAAIRVAVNISARQFRQQEDFVNRVREIVRETGYEPRNLELELTESLLMDDPDEAVRRLERLHALGITLAIDDFGTGYSSLSYLKRLPVDRLKIDQSFVRDMINDPDDARIVKAMILLGHSLGLRVVAEGVEEQVQWRALRAEGCDEMQGFYFARPLAPDDVVAFELKFRADAVKAPQEMS